MNLLAPAFLALLVTPTAAAAAPPAPPRPAPATTLALAPDQEDYEDDREDLIPDAIERLEVAAKACQKAKALVERNDIYIAILELDPDHALARKVLKYSKDRKTGEWTRRRAYKAPKASKPEAVAEAVRLRTEAGTPWVDGILGLLKEHGDDLEPLYLYGELDLCLRIAPDHPALRERLGYVRQGGDAGPWVFEEIARTEARRAEIAKRVDELREAVDEPEARELNKNETEWDFDLVEPIGTKRVRVVADAEYDERADAVREVEVAWNLLHDLTGRKPKKLRDLTIYLLADADAAARFVDASSLWGDKEKDGAKYVIDREDSYRFGSDFVMCYRDTSAHRLDSAVSEAVDIFLMRNFSVFSFQGWANLGIRTYTTELLLGTRMTFPSDADVSVDLQRRSRGGELGDWNVRARDLMREVGPKFLENLIERSSFGMLDEHVIISYAFVGYLFEGHGAEVAGNILKRVVKGDSGDETEVFEEQLGMPIEVLQQRFAAWLEATAVPEAGTDGEAVEASGPRKKR